MSYADALRNECSTLKTTPGNIAIIGHIARVLRARASKRQSYNLRVSPDVRGTGTIAGDIRRFRRSGFGPAPGRALVQKRHDHSLEKALWAIIRQETVGRFNSLENRAIWWLTAITNWNQANART